VQERFGGRQGVGFGPQEIGVRDRHALGWLGPEDLNALRAGLGRKQDAAIRGDELEAEARAKFDSIKYTLNESATFECSPVDNRGVALHEAFLVPPRRLGFILTGLLLFVQSLGRWFFPA